jgi:predicted outer membrane repeat protein
VLRNCTITGNSATVYGGGITASTDRVYVLDTTISSNTTGYAGAGMAA